LESSIIGTCFVLGETNSAYRLVIFKPQGKANGCEDTNLREVHVLRSAKLHRLRHCADRSVYTVLSPLQENVGSRDSRSFKDDTLLCGWLCSITSLDAALTAAPSQCRCCCGPSQNVTNFLQPLRAPSRSVTNSLQPLQALHEVSLILCNPSRNLTKCH